MKKLLILLVMLCLIFVGFSSVGAESIRMATFTAGSGWHIQGEAMAEVMRANVSAISMLSVLPYTGGVGNPILLHQKEAEIALGFPTETQLAIAGEWPYEEEMPGLNALVGHLDLYWYVFTVRKDTGITSVQQILDEQFPLRLMVLTPGSSGDWTTRNFLEAHGLSYDMLRDFGGSVQHRSFAAAADAVRDGRADAFAHVCTPGHPTWTELAATTDITFLPISDEAMEFFQERYGYVADEIPVGEFRGIISPVPVIGFYTTLLATVDLSEEIAYQITKAIVENKEYLISGYAAFRDFRPEIAWDVPLPLHEGALRYYREMGYLD